MQRDNGNETDSRNHGACRATIGCQKDGEGNRATESTGIACFPGRDDRSKAKAGLFLREWCERPVPEDQTMHPEGGDVTFHDCCEHISRTGRVP